MNSSINPIDKNFKCKINELWLQYLWKSNVFENESLFTTIGHPLKIIFPGWFNNTWGPDFKESRIIIGNSSYFGDIECHIDEAAWYQHSHHLSESYNKVVLHVFLNKSDVTATNTFGHPIPSLNLKSDFLVDFWKSTQINSKLSQEELPGACGLSLNKHSAKKLKLIIQQAAETRLIAKSEKFKHSFKREDRSQSDDILFDSICRSLGYSAFTEQLEAISQLYPYSHLRKFFNSPQRQNRSEILSRWLGCLKLFERIDINQLHEDLRREWLSLKQQWRQLEQSHPPLEIKPRTPYRPYNNPVRRLIGLYYHLQSVQFKGLVGSWLRFFKTCESAMSTKNSKTTILAALDKMFPQPSWDPFSYFNPPSGQNNFKKNSRFIGKQKQLVILVNSIIPFFLSWSRLHDRKELEKLLFQMLLILPGEGKNRKIRFMENRLYSDNDNFRIKNSLSYCQGLIQIHDDSCTSFYEGCRQCSLLGWLQDPNR